MAHALQHCAPVSAPRNKRHHGVVNLLADAIRKTQHWTVAVDRVPHGTSTNLRPDLLCTNTDTGRKILVDVKVPFETRFAVDEAARRNQEKYADVAQELHAEIFTFSVGALGSWRHHNDRLLQRTFRLQGVATLRDNILRHVLHWSRNTYMQFVTDVPQTF